ncbi:glycosyltransferase [Pseudooceanicola sp.]|uniref:glycosyltransferase n=1 Tax=Pseudooceanicola sp. TaxID=1914328 RepID=UPI0035C6F19F
MEITVLMPVLNGGVHLVPQLESLADQSHLPTRLILSDDGSSDGTLARARAFARRAPFEVRILTGPRQGYAANVLSLLHVAPGGAVAYCDQDDIWAKDRIARGLAALRRIEDPALHVVARRPFGGRRLGDRRGGARPCPFATALVQNLAPANATLLNPAAAAAMRRGAGRLAIPPPFPDWWAYGLITGMDGRVLFDAAPGVFYRDHGANFLGSARSFAGIRRRVGYLCDGSFGSWLRQNTRALNAVSDMLSPAARDRLSRFSAALAAGRGAGWLALADRADVAEWMLLRVAASLRLV